MSNIKGLHNQFKNDLRIRKLQFEASIHESYGFQVLNIIQLQYFLCKGYVNKYVRVYYKKLNQFLGNLNLDKKFVKHYALNYALFMKHASCLQTKS